MVTSPTAETNFYSGIRTRDSTAALGGSPNEHSYSLLSVAKLSLNIFGLSVEFSSGYQGLGKARHKYSTLPTRVHFIRNLGKTLLFCI